MVFQTDSLFIERKLITIALSFININTCPLCMYGMEYVEYVKCKQIKNELLLAMSMFVKVHLICENISCGTAILILYIPSNQIFRRM